MKMVKTAWKGTQTDITRNTYKPGVGDRHTWRGTQTDRGTQTQRKLERERVAVTETKANTRDGHMDGQERLAKRRNAGTFLDKFILVGCQGLRSEPTKPYTLKTCLHLLN